MKMGDRVRVNAPDRPWEGTLISTTAHEGGIWSVLRHHDGAVSPVEERHMEVIEAEAGKPFWIAPPTQRC